MMINYVKNRKWYLIWLIIVIGIFSTISFLYSLPLDGILYGILICAAIFFLVTIFDFVDYRKKHLILLALYEQLEYISKLPKPKGLHEEEYQRIINGICEKMDNTAAKNNYAYSEMKDFYTLWVHQIKTPISAMSLLLQNDISGNGKTLRAELFKIERYTDLVLNYLRIEDISNDLALSNVDLEAIVKDTIRKFAPIFISKNIGVSIDGIKAMPISDEKWLTFAIEQLVSNSLKYTDKGGTIKFYTNQDCNLIIEDNGIGISPEDINRIFEKGFTGYNGRMDKKATGLGLYLTKKTLDKLGHRIEISSDGETGTHVKIYLSNEKIIYE